MQNIIYLSNQSFTLYMLGLNAAINRVIVKQQTEVILFKVILSFLTFHPFLERDDTQVGIAILGPDSDVLILLEKA